jgi:hypothetical protein
MRSQIPALLRNEIAKAVRCKLPYFGLFGAALICVLTYVVADEISTADTGNAWGYVTLSMQLVFTDIGLIFVLVFSALLMADETRCGTIRAMLAAPLYRWEFYAAKAIMGLLYMVVMSVATLGLSMALAKVHYPFGAVSDSFGVIYSQGKVLGNFLLAFVLTWIPLGAIVLYGRRGGEHRHTLHRRLHQAPRGSGPLYLHPVHQLPVADTATDGPGCRLPVAPGGLEDDWAVRPLRSGRFWGRPVDFPSAGPERLGGEAILALFL